MKMRARYVLMLLLMFGLVGCATSAKKEVEATAAPPEPTLTAVNISDYAVEFQFSGEYTYTVYKPSDPYTVAVDVPGVDAGTLAGKMPSDKAGVSEVIITATDTPAKALRIEILLDSPFDVDAIKSGNTLTVRINKTETEPVVEYEKPPVMVEPEVEPPTPQEILPPAQSITDISFDYTDGTIKLVITGDGSMMPEVFSLDERIIIDIPDVVMAAKTPAAVVAPVKAIRHGIHDGKVRFVIDLKEIVEYTTTAVGNSVVVALPADEIIEISAPTPGEPAEGIDEEGAEVEGKRYMGKIISLDFQNADIIPIFRFLGDVSGYNVVVHPGVSGRVTLKLLNVPWDQALDIILGIFSLEAKFEGNIMTIAPTSVFDRIARDREQRKTTKSVTAELVRRVFHLKYIPADEMKTIISEEKVMSARGRTRTDATRNLLIIWDTPEELQKIKSVIKSEDIPEKRERQIMIEAKIVEVRTSSSLALGIRWGGDWALDGEDLSGGFSINSPPVDAGPTAEIAGGAADFLIGTVDTFQINMSLSALETVGESKTLANPRVLTIDTQGATIQSGSQIPITTTTAEGSTTEFKNANLSLNVTPTIKPNGIVELQVAANNDSPSADVDGGIETNSVTTTALVKDGETLVLGGIYQTTETDDKDGVPGLRTIPILGWLFKAKSSSLTTSELLILITPKIIKEAI